MPHTLKLEDGEAFVEGRSQSKARKLLKAAKDAKLDARVVRATSNGYIVPKSLVGDDKPTDSENDSSEIQDAGDGDQVEEQKLFDPSEHDVKEVEAYLKDASEEEQKRVLAAEKEGKARKTLLPEVEGNED